MMRVTLLGTGASAGVPMIGGVDGAGDWGVCDPAEGRNRRTRTSITITSADGTTLLVDTGPDLREQLLACRVRRVDGILYTHSHADHITGLDDVRILNRLMNRPLPAYATAGTLDELKTRFGYAFQPWQKPSFFRPVLNPVAVEPGEEVVLGPIRARVFDQDHGFTHTLGLRVGGFGYSTDAVALDEAAFAALAGVEVWAVGCFQRAPHMTHAWLERVLEWVARVRPRRTILTHMGIDMDWAWLADTLPEGVEAGWDGQVLEIASPGR